MRLLEIQETFSIQQIKKSSCEIILWDKFFIFSLSFHFLVTDASKGLKNLTLSVYPEVIRRGQSAQLHCNYDILDSSILIYSVKYYRGTFEFYRYTPFEHPPQKTFYSNTAIKVDVSINSFSLQHHHHHLFVLFAYFITSH